MRTRVVAITVFMALLACSGVSPAAAYSSTVDVVCDITTIINDLIIDVPGDVGSHTNVSPASSDDNNYTFIENEDNGYPASYITAKTDDDHGENIVGAGDSFSIDVTIPAGITYCFRLTLSSALTNNTIKVTSSDFSGTISKNVSWGRSIDIYVGVNSNGKLAESSSMNVWITSDTETTIHLEGDRGLVAGLNLGQLKVELIMQRTQA